MWIPANPNPAKKQVPDCVIRAMSIAFDQPWLRVYDELCATGRKEFNMPSADAVWGRMLKENGCVPFLLPEQCPACTTVEKFSHMYPRGIYIIGTGSHAVSVIDGNYYDSWNSGQEIPSFFWRID